MSLFHFVRVLFAIALAGAIGWVALVAFNAVKIMQKLEALEAASNGGGGDFMGLERVLDNAIGNIQGGSAVFLAAGIAGVLLSEVFKTRSLLFYAGATGALTAVLAAALWQHTTAAGNAQAAAALAMAGFVSGGVYWMIAGHSGQRG